MRIPTLETLIGDLEKAKQMAFTNNHITGAISATLAQAKLLGLDDGKQTETEPTPVKVVIDVVNARREVIDQRTMEI